MELESDNEELAEEDNEVRVCDWRNCGADASGLKDLVAHVNSKHVQVKSDIPPYFELTVNTAFCKWRLRLLVEELP